MKSISYLVYNIDRSGVYIYELKFNEGIIDMEIIIK